jgi:nickel transport protein
MINRSFLLAVAILAGFASTSALAHKVNMFAFVQGDQIVVQGYFSDGKKAAHSQVQVFGSGGDKLVEGTTDAEGMYTFDVPQIVDLRIALYAGMGHRAEYRISKAELAGVKLRGGADAAATPSGASATGVAQAADGPVREVEASDASGNVPPGELDAVVRKAVGEAMLPVVRGLSELKEARTFSDIVGGIGFIVGIIGIFFYYKARKMIGGRGSGGAQS